MSLVPEDGKWRISEEGWEELRSGTVAGDIAAARPDRAPDTDARRLGNRGHRDGAAPEAARSRFTAEELAVVLRFLAAMNEELGAGADHPR